MNLVRMTVKLTFASPPMASPTAARAAARGFLPLADWVASEIGVSEGGKSLILMKERFPTV